MIALLCESSIILITFQSFFGIIKDALPLLIAVIVAYIAYQQYIINRNKLRLDLFEKRFAVYKKLKDLILKITSEAGIPYVDVIYIYSDIYESQFLFGKEVYDFIQEIIFKNGELGNLGLTLGPDNTLTEEQRISYHNKRSKILDSLMQDFTRIEDIFMKYLQFKDVSVGLTRKKLAKTIMLFFISLSNIIYNLIHLRKFQSDLRLGLKHRSDIIHRFRLPKKHK